MSLLSQAVKDKEFDTRMVQRKLNKGLLLQDELDKHIKKLPDDAENADFVNLETMMETVANKSGLQNGR